MFYWQAALQANLNKGNSKELQRHDHDIPAQTNPYFGRKERFIVAGVMIGISISLGNDGDGGLLARNLEEKKSERETLL